MKWFVSLRARLMLLALAGVSISGIGFLITTGYTQWRIRRAVGTEISQLGESDCRHSVQAMYLMVRSIDEQTKVQLGEALAGCKHLVQQQGGLLQAAETVTWNAVNQLSKEKQEVVLPRLVLGQQWLGQVSDPTAPVPLLDTFAHASSAKCTIFQRMNAKGDMLRVATNVVNKEGKRAIGSYIPAADPAGKPSEVIATVLAGKTYKGRAYVVDRWYQTFYEPFLDAQGAVIGMLYVGLPLEGVASLRAGINDFKLGTSGYVYVVGGSGDQKGDYVISPGGKRDGQSLLDHARKELHPALTELIERPVNESSFEKPLIVRYAWRNPEDPAERQKIAAAIYYEPWDWIICASVYEDEYFAGMAKLNRFLSGLAMISLALIAALIAASAVFGRIMACRVLRPIEAMRERVKDLVAGEGDLTLRMQADGGDEIAALGGQFNLFLEHIHHLMKQVAHAGEQVAALSGEISQNNDQVSGTIQHQNQQLEQITAAIEEMSGSVTEVAIQTASAAEHATTTGRIADQGGEVIRHSLEDMDIILQAVIAGSDSLDQLAHRGDEIGGVIDMIKNIADQTNLLALNAAIEAARAGEHGRGFAVVASEVRLLAERTKDATGQIGSTIRVIQEETTDAKTRMSKDRGRADGAREAAQQVTVNLERIVTSSKDVAMLIQSIAAAVEQQSATSSQITCAVSELHRGAQSTLGAAEHATQAAHGLNVVADDLRGLIGRFKL